MDKKRLLLIASGPVVALVSLYLIFRFAPADNSPERQAQLEQARAEIMEEARP